MIPAQLHTPAASEKLPLQIRYYGTTEASWNLYDDDGITFDYERGKYNWARLDVKKDKKGQLTGSWTAPKDPAFHYSSATWEFMTR
ncbi:DUF5110 domain-containing protein [Spirosoma telluris]|uniref:DUF5110 domain-containing protein n=1 Tax=Spirosoma telluris TaxID=2183553 RepID=UPI002FC31867